MFELSINAPDILGCSFGRDASRPVGDQPGQMRKSGKANNEGQLV